MFLIRWIRILLSAPPHLCAVVVSLFNAELAGRLFFLVWRLTRNGDHGLSALGQYGKCTPPDVVLARAEQMVQEHPSPELAAFAGMLEMQVRHDLAKAREHLNRAKELGGDPKGITELLEFQITDGESSVRGTRELAEDLAVRRDLSPTITRLVLEFLALGDLLRGDHDHARSRAEHLLKVSRNPKAEIILWALAERAGNAPEAQACLVRSTGMPPAHRLYYQALACRGIGRRDQAEDMLASLRDMDTSLADRLAHELAEVQARP